MASVDDIRTVIEKGMGAGYKEALQAPHAYFADTVEMVHVPPNPADGVRDAEALRAMAPIELDAVRTAMPDVTLTGDVLVEGDEVVMKAVLSGTLGGSQPFSQDLEQRYLVTDGRIVRMTSVYDPEQIKPLVPAIMEAFAKAGVSLSGS